MLTQECRFCIRYLLNHGVNSLNFDDAVKELGPIELDDKFRLVKIPKKIDFFDNLASKLRELWPPGNKDGKYPWRESVPNLSKRLRSLWRDRFPEFVENENSIEQCLTVARRYLSRFENDTKYMRTLKYFIMKQKEIVQKDGSAIIVVESIFADMLEGKSDEDAVQNEWDFLVNEASVGDGELI